MRAVMVALALVGSPVAAQEVAREDGLDAWTRIYAVASHPRCTNCHVGESGRPGWAGLGYGAERLHAMNIQAGESRIGAETIPCRVCHIGASGPNSVPHAAPQVDDAWRLPPVELAWRGKTSVEVCEQMRDPERNDGFDVAGLVEHVRESAFVNWGFVPGGGREPAPGSAAALASDIEAWGAAGLPCEDG
ncbi:hypothetical protein KDD17_02830 [Sulfitobacter albidus]|uniref:Cytochrome c domain-containing protein n=1 Tax=Sulfitobacter albidus TaxID=2829501 RepID=A0A975PN20_9RHOB|nr:hypothetical protein [Sulfitobacter albidus]QUJ77001.1 hypothetical protein KDD17_02830 [Sulfitobacter albidus]